MSFVLVIEDDDDGREAIIEALADAGIAARMARDGTEGVAALQDGELPALILVDEWMPRMSGRAFLDWLAARSEYAGVPAVITSGDSTAARHPRAAAVLRKPYDLESLLEMARRFISG